MPHLLLALLVRGDEGRDRVVGEEVGKVVAYFCDVICRSKFEIIFKSKGGHFFQGNHLASHSSLGTMMPPQSLLSR